MRRIHFVILAAAASLSLLFPHASAAQVESAPDRGPDEGQGPFDRLVIRGVTVIDGAGGMPRGPADIVIEDNRIADIQGVGVPGVPIDEDDRPEAGDFEIDAEGMYVLPGFVDLHAHTGGSGKAPEAEYVYKLWLAHGVTTARGVPFGSMEFSLSEQARSAANEIVAPRMVVYQRPGNGEDWDRPIRTPDDARAWVRYAHENGVQGLKLGAYRPAIMEALIDEANSLGMGSTAHLGQTGVARMNALDAARLGMTGFTHFYGLFEALYEDHDVQPWPSDINYADEQHRFGQVARQWNLVAEPGSDRWNAVLEEFLAHDYFINPTMVIYEAGRDVMRSRQAVWHDDYTLPSLMDFYRASRTDHGSYWYYWTTWDEVAWRNFYDIWMEFLDDYKDRGGRVTVGSDAGFIYKTYGFSTIEEMELLQEAGFHPLEVIRAATYHGAQEIFEPRGEPIEFGEVREGLLADLVIVDENPLENLKVLYGTGAVRLNDETGQPERVGGIEYTIKDGIVYDAEELLADVREMVDAAEDETEGQDSSNASREDAASGGVGPPR
jgi:imidazolonepropionase-like amidohydrolase